MWAAAMRVKMSSRGLQEDYDLLPAAFPIVYFGNVAMGSCPEAVPSHMVASAGLRVSQHDHSPNTVAVMGKNMS